MLTPELKNDTITVRDLVNNYRSGLIVIPEFQRDYVWPKKRAPKLIDSLYKKFPISTLLLWRSSENVKTRRSIPKRSTARNISWLIDGQQRVITLSRVLYDDGIEVLFNAETENFSLPNPLTRNHPDWVPVATLFDDNLYRDLRRELPASSSGKKREALYDKVRDIRNYQIPVVTMIDHSFNDAVDAFTRINSLGVRLKSQDIESARVAAAHTGLIADQVVPFMKQISDNGLKRLTVMHLFRVCAFIATPDLRTRTPLHELPKGEVLNAWKRTEKATLKAAGLMRSELHLVNMEILWSGSLLVPVIAMLATGELRKIDPKAMVGWLALAAMLHRYSRASSTAVIQDLRACRQNDPISALLANLRQRRNELLAKPEDFSGALNDRSGLLATYIACQHRQMTDVFTGQRIILQEDIDRHHILPRRQFHKTIRTHADVVANIAFITSEVNKSISNTGPEVYLNDIKPERLASQCIPLDPTLWRISKAEGFFAARRELLAESFNEFVRKALPNRHLHT